MMQRRMNPTMPRMIHRALRDVLGAVTGPTGPGGWGVISIYNLQFGALTIARFREPRRFFLAGGILLPLANSGGPLIQRQGASSVAVEIGRFAELNCDAALHPRSEERRVGKGG